MSTKEKILDAALKLAEGTHYQKISRAKLAKTSGFSESAIQYHFKEPWRLRYGMMLHAIRRENLIVLGQGLGALDNVALTASPELRECALKHIRNAADGAETRLSREISEMAKRI